MLLGVDLTKDFYFSYTYCIMQSMQANVKSLNDEQMPYDNMFVWNTFLTSGIRQALNNTRWTVALVHGFFEQVTVIQCISFFLFTRWIHLWIGCLGEKIDQVIRLSGKSSEHTFRNFLQEKLSIFGRIFVITLIGRRSRHFAGTRYALCLFIVLPIHGFC